MQLNRENGKFLYLTVIRQFMTKKKMNTADAVKEFLGENRDIRIVMSRGLINTTELARCIIKEKNLDATLDAAISAKRRYELDPVLYPRDKW